MASSLFIDLHGQPIAEHDTLGYGRSGVVIRRGPLAVKLPLRHPWSSDADLDLNIEVLLHEQEVYRRFNSFERDQINGVVPCIELSTNATHLAYMENGDLRTYLENHRPPRVVQIAWFRQMARVLEQIHDKRVLAADIATRNFLLDSDLSIKMCDFSEASLLSLDTSMETADDNGFSKQTDIGQLGAVMYEVATGLRCQFDLFKDTSPDSGRATWPQRASLPRTDGLWLGPIIEKCWTKRAFRSAHCLTQALNALDVQRLPEEVRPLSDSKSPPIWHCQHFTPAKAVTALAVAFGMLMALTTWDRRLPRS